MDKVYLRWESHSIYSQSEYQNENFSYITILNLKREYILRSVSLHWFKLVNSDMKTISVLFNVIANFTDKYRHYEY